MKKIIFTILALHFSFIILNGQWYPQVSGTNSNLRDIEFLNRYTGWVVGDGGVILKTTNSGINWINIPNPAVGKPLTTVNIIDSNNIYVVGWFETIIKTTNGGFNWIELKNGPWGQGSSYDGSFFYNENTGWVVGISQSVLKTTDGGYNYALQSIPGGDSYLIYFKNAMTGITTAEVTATFKTTNGGSQWYIIQMPFNGQGSIFDKMAVVNNQKCWVVGRGTRIVFFSNDFGDTWDTISNIPYISPTGWLFCCNFSNSLVGWVAGEYNRLFKTTNGGYNWAQQKTGPGTWFWRDIFSYSDSIVWGVGGGGRIMHTTNGGQTLVDIHNANINVPKEFKLYQNYPNPFNSETIINFDINKDGNTKLIVYDVLGREIARLVDEYLPKGIHKVKFDIGKNKQKCSGSIYFYSLYFDGKLIETRKLVFIP
jgi:photosystem II stability/assembly factor-like uncharacterized protein